MATVKGDMQSIGLFGWFNTDPDYPAEAEVQVDVDFGNGAYTGTYDPGGTVDIKLEDAGVQVR